MCFTALCLGLLFQGKKTSAPKRPQKAQQETAFKQVEKVASQSSELTAIPSQQIPDERTIELQKTARAILGRMPKSLKPRAVINVEESNNHTNGVIRRAIVTTDSALGKMLLIESMEKDRIVQHLYSAEHLVIQLEQSMREKRITSSITKSRFEISKPYPAADFLYAHLDIDTPSALLDSLDALSTKLDGLARVELDGAGSGGGAPSDPSYSQQWHHQTIDSPAAWELTQGDDSIIVAVVDSGVNESLAEFNGRIISGYDYVNDDSDPSDDRGHGTAVAGTILANANNGVSIAGVDWRCKLMPVKVLDSSGWGYYSWWAAGINYATDNGAHVINLSASGSGSSTTLTGAINNAINAGLIFVTTAGNDGDGSVKYPGSLLQAITVGATERNDVKAPFSNWGAHVDMVAPGRDIYTVNQYGNLGRWWGTSFAAPQVAGAAALLLSLKPELDQAAITALLIAGAEDQVGDSQDAAGFDAYYGWGRLNVYNSILLAQTSASIEKLSNRRIRLQWEHSPNAESKAPYKIKWSSNLVDWNTINSPSISYGSTAEWIDDGTETAAPREPFDSRFYLIEVGME